MATNDGGRTLVDEALAFTQRHPDLDVQQKSFGGLLWGSLRALAECPNCPGHFRVPLNRAGTPDAFGEWATLVCQNCQGIWTKEEGK